MKLGDRDLHYALWCAEKHTGNSLYAEAMADLEEGVLDIEGYKSTDHFRDVTKMVDEWTKFDSSKGSTYPPNGKFLAWGLPDPDGYGAPTEFICWRDDGGFSCHESADPEVLYWQPLPNPPVEKARSENESK